MENAVYTQYTDAVKSLYKKNRAVGLFLMKMKIRLGDENRCDTACTDRYNIYISRQYQELCTTPGMKEFVLAHEALHRILGHFNEEHRNFINNKINTGFKLALYKAACELEVNLWITKNLDVDMFVPQPPVKDKWLAMDMNAFELYDDMINDPGYLEMVITGL